MGKKRDEITPTVLRMIGDDARPAEIAAAVGMSRSSLSHWLRARGIKLGIGRQRMEDRQAKPAEAETRVLAWLPGYSVARDGTIYSEHGDVPIAMVPRPHDRGGIRVRVSLEGRVRDVYVAVVVLEAYAGPRPEGHVVGYRDGDHSHCRAENLFWLPGRTQIDPAEFVRTWQRACSLREVAERLGITAQYACANAAIMRRHGVRLKRMREPRDWEALARLADGADAEGGESTTEDAEEE